MNSKLHQYPYVALRDIRRGNPNAVTECCGPDYDVVTTYEYRDVTALASGKQFHAKVFVSEPAMNLIAERGRRVMDSESQLAERAGLDFELTFCSQYPAYWRGRAFKKLPLSPARALPCPGNL